MREEKLRNVPGITIFLLLAVFVVLGVGGGLLRALVLRMAGRQIIHEANTKIGLRTN